MSTAATTIGTAFTDPRLFGPWFEGSSWDNWRAVLRGAFGERLRKSETAFFREVAHRDPPPGRPKELWIIAGRRAGKDSVASGIAAHTGASFKPDGRLRPGERALVACLAVDRAQAATVLNYTRSYFERVPALKALVEHETADGFELSNSVDIAIVTNDYRSIRGRTILCAILDEVGFWRDEHSSSPDTEVFRAIRPGMATLAESMLVGITSPHRRAGLAYDRWSKHFGRDSKSVLVVQAESRMLNPTLDQAIVDDALEEDRAAALADYFAQWRDDLASYIQRELIEAAVDVGVTVRPPEAGRAYMSWVDASSGAADSFAAAVCHAEGRDLIVLDCLVEVPAPFNTADATAQVASVLKSYGLRSTTGDDYARGWVVAEFARHGIRFEPRPSAMNRSTLYLETLPLFSAGRVRLLDSKRLVAQYAALERRVMAGGRDRVDHPNRAGHHDDLSNVTSGCLWRASQAAPIPGNFWAAAAAASHRDVSGERRVAQLLRARSPRFA